MTSPAYSARKHLLTEYFDRTAADTWAQLTSQAPVSRVRATVRAGRDAMRALLLSWLPQGGDAATLLDAGCGTGALAIEAAARGMAVTAIDVAGNLVAIAEARAAEQGAPPIQWRVGDMLDAGLGRFNYAVAMDSLIHYQAADIVRALAALAPRIEGAILFTFAPQTTALSLMHAVGQVFPKADRSPAIEPVSEAALRRRISGDPALQGFAIGRTERVASGFYTSQAMELLRR